MSAEDPKYRVDGEIDGRSTRGSSSRPIKPVDWDLVDELLLAGCNSVEIAPHFNLHPTTFCEKVFVRYNMTFTAYSTEKRSEGHSILRKAQFDKATKGDSTMLIWLGKNRLDQRDKDLSKEIEEIKADLGRLCQGLAQGREQHDAAQSKDHSSSQANKAPE